MKKVPKNLYLDPDAVERAERYGKKHDTNLSQLVSDFLRSLPLDEPDRRQYSPVVQRLIGAASSKKRIKRDLGVEDYHRYLLKKYGGDK